MENQDTSTETQPAEKKYAGMSRRSLCLGIGGAAALLALGGIKYVGSTPVVRPPGGQDEEHLLSSCIRCEKCIEICPHDVIVPSRIEDGILGMRTPTLNFSQHWCDWCQDANGGVPLCTQVCPTEALSLPANATPENTIIGKATIITDWCLAYRLKGCRFCFDACPYEAIELDETKRPHVIADRCNGCGACESVCVSLQNASISEGATSRAIVIRPSETW